MCGEQIFKGNYLSLLSGSSPRVRGTICNYVTGVAWARFIPACAGNRARRFSSRSMPTVHPRVCGEQLFASNKYSSSAGSSPRVRGTGKQKPGTGLHARFIPACAGNRETISSSAFRCPGSSPRVRGTGCGQSRDMGWDRFIPACAGNSWPCALPEFVPAVHPRVCGEQMSSQPGIGSAVGSSPRVRGTAGRGAIVDWVLRFIPACAGNSWPCALPEFVRAVHPRVCGEQDT